MEEQANKKNPFKFSIQLAALALILIILPGGTWLASKYGLDYFLGVMGDLEDFGPRNAYDLNLVKGNDITFEDLSGNVNLVAFLEDPNSDLGQQLGEVMGELHRLSDDQRHALFLIHYAPSHAAKIDQFATTYNLEDNDQCFFIEQDPAMLAKTANSVYYRRTEMPLDAMITLVDSKGLVRRHYDISQPEERKLLVEQMAILTPENSEKDLIIKREQEK